MLPCVFNSSEMPAESYLEVLDLFNATFVGLRPQVTDAKTSKELAYRVVQIVCLRVPVFCQSCWVQPTHLICYIEKEGSLPFIPLMMPVRWRLKTSMRLIFLTSI